MTTCRPHLCEDCGDWLIHQGGRKRDESASPFGQWIHDKLPRTFTTGDVDQYVRKWYPGHGAGRVLLRWLEHKTPSQRYQKPQRRALADFNHVIRHAIDCPTAPLALDPESGVYVVRSSFRDGKPENVTLERLHDERTSRTMTAQELAEWIAPESRREAS